MASCLPAGPVYTVDARLRAIYVDDDRFADDFARWTVGTRGQRGRIAKYVLARLETHAGEREVDPETDPATVEHVLPENPAGGWADVLPPDRWEAATDRLGNLTLLERGLNRDVWSSTSVRPAATRPDL